MSNLLAAGFNIWFLIKIITLAVLVMYIIFAVVVIRQVKLMTDSLKLGLEGFLKFLAYVHLIFAILVLLTALITL